MASGGVARVGAGVASLCACPACGAALPAEAVSGYCGSCGAAWLMCVDCNAPVDTLSRYCPRDGRRVDLSSSPPNRGHTLQVRDAAGTGFEFHERFLHAPRDYAGYLWLLSERGNLYRFSPPAHKTHVESFRDDYGAGPFDVVNRVTARPLLAAVAKDTIALIDPATHKPADEPQRSAARGANRGAHKRSFVRLMDSTSAAVAHADGSFAAIARDKQDTGLVVWDPRADTTTWWPFRADVRHGPFALGSVLCAYSATHLHWFDGAATSKSPLPARFEPLDPRTTVQPLRSPWGRPAFVQSVEGVYIPGQLDRRPAFLFVELAGGTPAMAIAATDVLRGDESYRLSAEGHVVVAGRSGIHLMTRTALRRAPLEVPGEVQSGPAVVIGGSAAALFKGTHGEQEIRVYPEGTRLDLPAGHEVVDVHVLPGCLSAVLVSLADGFLTVVTWPLAS